MSGLSINVNNPFILSASSVKSLEITTGFGLYFLQHINTTTRLCMNILHNSIHPYLKTNSTQLLVQAVLKYLIVCYTPTRLLCSSVSGLLAVLSIRGPKSKATAEYLSTFKKDLKTYIFQIHFSSDLLCAL
ncbi:hypothetical protein Z043_115389 [Scleropages formosus]|uniref:Uncharacterized protein n=1 Tax=Scleropages formosus TaxID=113540 RepID=A0A0P7V1L9_SCLFO|nr:hypothetical protein Z043_115389 [Scleropages formosus]